MIHAVMCGGGGIHAPRRRLRVAVFPVNCELPHIWAAKNMRLPLGQAHAKGKQMRAWMVGMAVVVAVGLIWSVAAMSKWVPVQSAEMGLAATSRAAE